MELIAEGRWRCPKTGLVLLLQPEVPAWRVFQAKFLSPVNPPVRSGPVGLDWSRFDLSGCATLYGAATRRGAFIESLAYADYQPAKIPVHEIFSDVAPDADPIAEEWRQLSHMAPSNIPANWRDCRRVVDIRLANPGYWVDITSAETVGALRRSAANWATGQYLDNPMRIDLAALTGADRSLTCAAAQWLAKQPIEDGREVRGVHYISKHGADISCWALWVPSTPGQLISPPATVHAFPEKIRADDPDLRWAAHQLDLVVW
jgi:hypothetical protein